MMSRNTFPEPQPDSVSYHAPKNTGDGTNITERQILQLKDATN